MPPVRQSNFHFEMPYCQYIEIKKTYLGTKYPCCYRRTFLICGCLIAGFLCTLKLSDRWARVEKKGTTTNDLSGCVRFSEDLMTSVFTWVTVFIQPCSQIATNQSINLLFLIEGRCLRHGFSAHFRFELTSPYPFFLPTISLKVTIN